MTDIHLVGTAGHPNYGDELITRTWLRFLASQRPDDRVWLDVPHPGRASALFGDDHPDLHCTRTLWEVSEVAPDPEPMALSTYVHDALADPGLVPQVVRGVERLREADTVHLLGGGYVNELWPRNFGLLAGVAHLARHHGARGAVTGAGLLPGVAPAGFMRHLLEPLSVVDFRDEPSQELAGDRGSVTCDDVLLAPAEDLAWRGEGDLPEVMVCVQRDLVDVDRGMLVANVLDLVAAWAPSSVGVVECIPHGDRKVFDELRPHLPDLAFFSLWELLATGFPARRGQKWISSRFHPHLLAAMAGADGVVMLIGDYYAAKHESLFQLGSGWRSRYPVAEVTDSMAGPGFSPSEVANMRESKAEVAARVHPSRATDEPTAMT